jgi:flagellar assembly factor FliW
MNTAELESENTFALGSETVIHLPCGLLGFEAYKKYLVQRNPDEEPFYWIQVVDEPSISFLAVSPFDLPIDYRPNIPPEDVRFLGIECPADVFLLNIVTLRRSGRSTVNLKGPIVINRFSLTGKQVVIANAAEYSVQHPLSTE